MIIGVCGFTSTGSSAAADYLKEFDENQVFNRVEFTISYAPDGLEDLEFQLMRHCAKYLSSNAAIERFRRMVKVSYSMRHATKDALLPLSEAFLDEIVQARWRGYGVVDGTLFGGFIHDKIGSRMRKRVIPKISRRLGRNVDLYPVRRMEFSIRPQNFYPAAQRLVKGMLDAMGVDPAKNTVLDQPFSGCNPQASFAFFDDPRAIVMDRDPRDHYLFAKNFLLDKGLMIPTDRVEDYVVYYRQQRKDMPYLEQRPDVLRLRFEDMIYEYDMATKAIRDFLGLGMPARPRSVFEPGMSINNTQLFLRYPQYEKEIRYIERELPEYLYPFEKYAPPKGDGQMFYGKSPLNN